MKVGLSELVTLVFVILKLTDVIHWGWFWVLFPLLVGFLFEFGRAWERDRPSSKK